MARFGKHSSLSIQLDIGVDVVKNQQPTNACVLSIAGSDSGGAAGVQADLRTFAAFGLHGLSAIAAVTSQNLHSVTAVHAVPSAHLKAQLCAVFDGFAIGAVKIGMLGSAANVKVVSGFLARARARNVVLDPVLASSSGTALLSARGLSVLRRQLIPLADMLTPNLPEAQILLWRRLRTNDAESAARDLLGLGARAVLLKGGHGRGDTVRDFLADASGVREFSHARLALRARGTGCMLASAIAAGLAQGQSLQQAVAAAQEFLQAALRSSYQAGTRGIKVLGSGKQSPT